MFMPFGASDECRIFEQYRPSLMDETDHRAVVRKLPSHVRETTQGERHVRDHFGLFGSSW
jgi:hypothetical protein